MKLYELIEGERAKVIKIDTTERIKKRLGDIGLCEGVTVSLIRFAPFDDPVEISLRGFYLAVRKVDAQNISVERL